jgi:hypothetical protein
MFGLGIEKMLIALVMSALGLIEVATGFSVSFISEEWLLSLIFVLTPILVWAAPNA